MKDNWPDNVLQQSSKVLPCGPGLTWILLQKCWPVK